MQNQVLGMIITVLCIGCKDRGSVGGIILDEETRKPIPNVYVSQKNIFKNTLIGDLDSSDKNGLYKYEHSLSGKYTDSGFVTLYFSKSGVSLSRKIRNGVMDDTVLLPARRKL